MKLFGFVSTWIPIFLINHFATNSNMKPVGKCWTYTHNFKLKRSWHSINNIILLKFHGLPSITLLIFASCWNWNITTLKSCWWIQTPRVGLHTLAITGHMNSSTSSFVKKVPQKPNKNQESGARHSLPLLLWNSHPHRLVRISHTNPRLPPYWYY